MESFTQNAGALFTGPILGWIKQQQQQQQFAKCCWSEWSAWSEVNKFIFRINARASLCSTLTQTFINILTQHWVVKVSNTS